MTTNKPFHKHLQDRECGSRCIASKITTPLLKSDGNQPRINQVVNHHDIHSQFQKSRILQQQSVRDQKLNKCSS